MLSHSVPETGLHLKRDSRLEAAHPHLVQQLSLFSAPFTDLFCRRVNEREPPPAAPLKLPKVKRKEEEKRGVSELRCSAET